MFGDFRPYHDWSDDERRMHWFFPKVAGLIMLVFVGIAMLAALLVHLAC